MANNNNFNRRSNASSHPQDQPLVSGQPTNIQTADKENEVRTTLDIPVKLHKTMKRLLLEKELTMKQYILQLIKEDLDSRGINIK